MTETVRGVQHTDVSLWYVLVGDCTAPLTYDEREFYGVAWFPLDELPLTRTDPHLARFVAKLRVAQNTTTDLGSNGFHPA